MSETPQAPPPLPAGGEDENPPSLLVVALLLALSLGLLASKADEISDAWNGPLALSSADVAARAGGLQGRWVEVQADEVVGTNAEQTTLHVLKIGVIPLPAGQDGARLAVVRTGQAYLAAYLASGVEPGRLAGKKLRGIAKAWPASLSRPEEISALVVDTTADEPSWFVGLLVAGFAAICVWQLWLGLRRRFRRAAP